ncbi:GNAT family N-acetyltransferase [Candidatus Pacearchaeota archaeon]|nr:GNAT family N-acetyltransferase [Candidatus Pacearchaeota archaeon]
MRKLSSYASFHHLSRIINYLNLWAISYAVIYIIGNFANFGRPFTHADEDAYVSRVMQSQTDRVFAVEAGGAYIGNAGIHEIYWPARNARLSLIIGSKEQQGRGYGQAALRAIVRIGFDDLNLHKLWLKVFSTNKRGLYMYDKHGFIREGTMRQEYYHRGEFHDMIRMSLLQEEYRSLQETELWKDL